MSKARSGNNNGAPPLTVGVIVSSLPPSQFKSLLGAILGTLVVTFAFAAWLTDAGRELQMKAHLVKDNEQLVIDAEKHNSYQSTIDALTAERDFWKARYESSEAGTGVSEGGKARLHPEKAPSLIIKAPKSRE